VALCYLHIVSQYRVGTDLEIFETDFIDSHTLNETCNVLQPIIFEWKVDDNISPIPFMETSEIHLNVKDTKSADRNDSLYLFCNSFLELSRIDEKSHYFTEKNHSFIQESNFLNLIQYTYLDSILRPPYTFQSEYDILSGSKGTCVPLRYHTYSRKFLYVTSGKILVKMTTWKQHDALKIVKDYETLDFYSTYNVWETNRGIDDKQFLTFEVKSGNVLYIPSFWFYSIQYAEKDTVVLEYNYSTFTNKLAFCYDSARYMLQQQNITTTMTTKMDTKATVPEANTIVNAKDADADASASVNTTVKENDTQTQAQAQAQLEKNIQHTV
jgi:hypothetical protein